MTAKSANISFFHIPMQCPSAPEIACGGRAKPILMELERDRNISEAWVNRAGTVLAVVGEESSSRESHAKVVQSLFRNVFEREVATEIAGEAREKELNHFLSGDGWYRGAQLDNLSREEADIIAVRLVRRLQAKVALSDEQTTKLAAGFAEALNRQFIYDSNQPKLRDHKPDPVREQVVNRELMKVAREHLDHAGAAAFQEAIAKGYRPEPGEK